MLRLLLLSTTPLLISHAAIAGEAAKKLPEIVITAGRLVQPKDQVGSAVTVITREEIEKSGASQLYDVIKQTPGISVNRNGGPGATSTVRIRGSEAGEVRVMIDGVYVNDPSGANTEFDFNSTLLSSVERIEILRGPQSALYGSDAMGGVINIITKKGDGPLRTTGLVEYGSYETHREALGASGAMGDWNYALNGENFVTDGFSRSSRGKEDDGARNQNVNAALGWQASDVLRFDASGYYTHLYSEYDPSATVDGPSYFNKITRTGRLASTLKSFGGKWEHMVSVQAAETERDQVQPNSAAQRYSAFDGLQLTGEYQNNLKLRTRDILTTGYVYERLEAENSNTTNAGVTTLNVDDAYNTDSIYGQYLLGLTDTTTLTFGGRHDDHSEFGTANTYRITASQELRATDTILRGSAGTGFKAPTLYQLFHPTFGNANLAPEESKGYDLGIDQYWLERDLQTSLTLFYNTYENLIAFQGGGYQNVTRANTRGVEASVDYDITDRWSASANYTYLLTEDEATGRVLRRRPKHSFGASVDYKVAGSYRLGADMRALSPLVDNATGSKIYVDGFATLDLRATYDISDHVSAYVRAENIFDRDYQEALNYNAPGRSFYVGLKGHY